MQTDKTRLNTSLKFEESGVSTFRITDAQSRAKNRVKISRNCRPDAKTATAVGKPRLSKVALWSRVPQYQIRTSQPLNSCQAGLKRGDFRVQTSTSPDEIGARGSGGVDLVRQGVKKVRTKFGLDRTTFTYWPKFGPVLVQSGRGPPKLGERHCKWPIIAHTAQKAECGHLIGRR